MRLFRRLRGAHLDEQVEKAREEAEKSRRRLEAVRATVVDPIREAGVRNQFADMLRRSLEVGHDGK